MKDTSKINDIFERVYECVSEAFYKGYNQGLKDCQDMSIKINDVIERSKIDAAIEEIKANSIRCYVGRIDGKTDEVILFEDVMDILKKYIGE